MTRAASNARALPHAPEIERSLLGGLLLDPSQLAEVAESLTASDFYRPHHAALWTLLCALQHEGGYDLALVLDQLAKLDAERFGGIAYVVALPNACPSVESIGLHAAKLRDLSARRRLILASWATLDAAEDPTRPTDELIGDANERMAAVQAGTRTGATWIHVGRLVSELGADLEDRHQRHREAVASGQASVAGTSTGFPDLDRMTQGLHGTDLVILAGRPAMGKSAVAMAMALAVARARRAVGVFSLEMSAKHLVQRLLATEAMVDAQRLRSGDLDESMHWPRVSEGLETLARLPLYFDEAGGVGLAQVRARTLRLKAERPDLGLIVIDYLQLMSGAGERQEAIAAISRGLKLLAKELAIPVLALSQLNRGVEQRADKRPMMSDLRESGAIEQDADVILMLYRDEVYNDDSPDKGLAELSIVKQRSGPIGTVKLAFIAQYVKFTSYSAPYSGEAS